MTVILDAGGCSGNICGIDEPRWHTKKSAVYSAGIRDMDAILGRDDRLADKIGQAIEIARPSFIALIGTPVPAVIGTDLKGLAHVLEKRFCLPVLPVETTGMEHYDIGIQLALEQLTEKFLPEHIPTAESSAGVLAAAQSAACVPAPAPQSSAGVLAAAQSAAYVPASPSQLSARAGTMIRHASADNLPGRRIGVWGMTPLDFPDKDPEGLLRYLCPAIQKEDQLVMYGISTAIDADSHRTAGTATGSVSCPADITAFSSADILSEIAMLEHAGDVDLNLAVTPAAIETVKKLERLFGTPYSVPGADGSVASLADNGLSGTHPKTSTHTAPAQVCSGQMTPAQACSGQTAASEQRILIIHQQFIANALRKHLRSKADSPIDCATWFMLDPDYAEEMDVQLKSEMQLRQLISERGYTMVYGDPAYRFLLQGTGVRYIDCPHAAVSGRAYPEFVRL